MTAMTISSRLYLWGLVRRGLSLGSGAAFSHGCSLLAARDQALEQLYGLVAELLASVGANKRRAAK